MKTIKHLIEYIQLSKQAESKMSIAECIRYIKISLHSGRMIKRYGAEQWYLMEDRTIEF